MLSAVSLFTYPCTVFTQYHTLVIVFHIEQVFADKIPLCTETDCAYEPKEEGEAYKGIVKPGTICIND